MNVPSWPSTAPDDDAARVAPLGFSSKFSRTLSLPTTTVRAIGAGSPPPLAVTV